MRVLVTGADADGLTLAVWSEYAPRDKGKPVSRGTLYTVFNYMPYDELERLGLDAGTEAAVRKDFPRFTGMLVVTEVLFALGQWGCLFWLLHRGNQAQPAQALR